MTYSVGLTGGIGSGKSTVASLFAELGVPVIDTDIISHQLTQHDGAAISEIQSVFGKDYIDANGALKREMMRKLVFTDSTSKVRLEKILHPLIHAQAKKLTASSAAPYVLVVIPLLFEAQSYLDWLNRTATVDCTEATQMLRASKRAGLNEKSVRAIMSQQLPRTRRLQLADDIILNDSSLTNLRDQIKELHSRYLQLAQTIN
jgi:dephospho-CoA kinase